MGCFMDSRENRLLRGHAGQLRRNTPNLCCDICFQRGYMYAGVEYGYVERRELSYLYIEYFKPLPYSADISIASKPCPCQPSS